MQSKTWNRKSLFIAALAFFAGSCLAWTVFDWAQVFLLHGSSFSFLTRDGLGERAWTFAELSAPYSALHAVAAIWILRGRPTHVLIACSLISSLVFVAFRTTVIGLDHLLATLPEYEPSWQRMVLSFVFPAVLVATLPVLFSLQERFKKQTADRP